MFGSWAKLFGVVLIIVNGAVWAQTCHTTNDWRAMSSKNIQLAQDGTVRKMRVRIADDTAKRAAGYQWLCATDVEQTAILFVFQNEINSTFHMRNVFVPLDIYFFDAQGQQVGSSTMRPEPPGAPLKPRYYHAHSAFKYALEIARAPNHNLQSTPTNLRLLVGDL